MKFKEREIQGVYEIEMDPFVDQRGLFRRHFCQREFERNGINLSITQCNVSENIHKHTFRGFHTQKEPHQEGKIISCFRGAVHDTVVDLRLSSRTYLHWISSQLTDKNRRSLYVPPGCANAYLTLEKNTWVFYYHSGFYVPGFELGIRYDDPYFDFRWPCKPAVISEKDKSYPDFVPTSLKKGVPL